MPDSRRRLGAGALVVLVAAAVAFVFALYITFAAIQARSGGSDEEPYSLPYALLIACLPAAGAGCAAWAARRAWSGAPGAGWLVIPSLVLSLLGVVGVLAGWGWL